MKKKVISATVTPLLENGNSFGSGKNDWDRIVRHFAGPDAADPWCWLFYGDSITHGAAHTHGWLSFPEIFSERVRWEIHHMHDVVINTGISGNTSADLLHDYDWRVRHWHPQSVFLLIGINDIVKLDDLDRYRENLLRLVAQIREDGAIPILQTYPPIQKHPEIPGYWKRYRELPAYHEAIRQIAQREDVILIDHARRWQDFASDPVALAARLGEPIHPGALGHLEMAKEIFRTFGVYDPEANTSNPVGIPFSIPLAAGDGGCR